MMLISPRRMLKTSGSSSSEDARREQPNFVNRWSSGRRFPFSSLASVIVLNLYRLKIRSSFPGRGCLKITGLPSLIRTRIVIMMYNHQNTITAAKPQRMSSSLLKYLSYKPYGLCLFSIDSISVPFSIHPMYLFCNTCAETSLLPTHGTADFLPRIALGPNTTLMISFITRSQKSLGNSVFLGLSLLLLKQGWFPEGTGRICSDVPRPAKDDLPDLCGYPSSGI